MWSSRYAPALIVALIVSLVPTIIHSYVGLVVTDGRTAATIPATLLAYSSSPTKRSATWGSSHFESNDWFEREYVANGDNVVLTVVRSYDLKALYHHPELAVAYHEAKFDRASTETPADRPDVPVHVLTDREAGPVALYVLHYGDRFIADPIRFQLRTAGELLFTGRKPMTLFFVLDEAPPSGVTPLELPATRLLFEAIDQFVGAAARGR